MTINVTSYHHSSSDSFLGLIIDNVANNEKTSPLLVLNDIDLFYQPVETISTASLFLVIRLILMTFGELINIKLFLQISKETCLVKDVTKVYTSAQIAFLPIWLLFNTSTDFVHPLNEIIGQWYCTLGWFSIHLCGTIISFYSFIVAIMRYLFIVHEKGVEKYGKEKANKVCLWLIIIIPLIVVLWEGTNGTDIDVMSVINKCNGKDHKIFLIEESTSDVFKNKVCEYDTTDQRGSYGSVFGLFRRFSCIANKLCMVLVSLNVAEGVIYYRLLAHIKR